MGAAILKISLFVIAFFLIMVILYVALTYSEFKRKLNYINSEIARTHGREREYWKRKRKRLILNYIRFK